MLERGREVPDAYYDRPEPTDEARFYWAAFCDLSTERQIGMGMGPIPRSAARAYAEEIGIGLGDAFDRFWSILREVDNEQMRLSGVGKNEAGKADKGLTVDATDRAGVRDIMLRFKERQDKKFKK